MYVFAGRGTSNQWDTVEYAAIHSDGNLDEWNTISSFSPALDGVAAAFHNGFIYLTGGLHWSNTYLSDVQYATFLGPVARAGYSKLLDTGPGDKMLDSIVFNTSTGGTTGYELSYKGASESEGSLTGGATVANAAPATVYASGLACSRYAWLRFVLDDTEGYNLESDATAASRKNITDFTLSYGTTLPGVGTSVRGEKTTSVHLIWDAAPDPRVDNYHVKGCNATAGPCTPATIGDTSSLYYDDPVLGDPNVYWYTVQSANGSCVSP